MKLVFIATMLHTADANEVNTGAANVAAQAEKVYTSDKLTALQAEGAEIWAKLTTCQYGSKEALEANIAMAKNNQAQQNEIAALKKAEQDEILAAKRNERVALVDKLLECHTAYNMVNADKKASAEDKNAAADAFNAAREVVVNEVLAKYAASKPSKPATEGVAPTGGSRGKTGEEIRSLFIANRQTGMSDTDNVKAIIAAGYSRGTTGAVVLAYQREIGEKA